MSLSSPATRIPRWSILAAYAVIYIIWGSGPIASRFSVETIPPLWMGGFRFLLSGILLYGWVRLRGTPAPTWANLRATAIACVFIFIGSKSLDLWATQYLPSSMIALLRAVMPMWMVLCNWVRPGGKRPLVSTIVGVMLGLGGIFLLVSPGQAALQGEHAPEAVVAVLAAAAFWVIGSLYAKASTTPESPNMSTALQLFIGGAMVVILGALAGEGAQLHLETISTKSIIAWVYLTIFTTLLGFACFVWLMRVDNPARVTTYAFVNPVVAVILGWWIGGETLSAQTLISAAVIVMAVMLITVNLPLHLPKLHRIHFARGVKV